MQRLMTALVAFFSLMAANLLPAGAQRPDDARLASAQVLRQNVFELPSGQTAATLVVRDKTFILAGNVAQDALAINCRVIIRPSATVGNLLTVIGGDVIDENDGHVRVSRLSAALLPDLRQTIIQSNTITTSQIVIPSQVRASVEITGRVSNQAVRAKPEGSWVGGQFALALVGLLSGIIALVIAPRATEQTGDALAHETGRCVVVGALGLGGMILALSLSYGLMRSPFSPLVTPLGAAFAGLCLTALVFGWVCGMRYAGQLLSRRLRRGGSLGMFLQFLLGIGGFFVASAVLGSAVRILGAFCVSLEFVLALAGLGAGLLTGFGADPNWLTARMRGEVRWTSRSARL